MNGSIDLEGVHGAKKAAMDLNGVSQPGCCGSPRFQPNNEVLWRAVCVHPWVFFHFLGILKGEGRADVSDQVYYNTYLGTCGL